MPAVYHNKGRFHRHHSKNSFQNQQHKIIMYAQLTDMKMYVGDSKRKDDSPVIIRASRGF
jgi:hypothetical protein